MKNTYPLEKFAAAVDAMAVSNASLQDRVFSAFMEFHPVQPEDMPDSHSAEMYKKLHADLSRFPAVGDEGAVRATLNRLAPDELRQVGQQIVDLRAYLEDALRD